MAVECSCHCRAGGHCIRASSLDIGVTSRRRASSLLGFHEFGSAPGPCTAVDGSLSTTALANRVVVAGDDAECSLERVPRVAPVRTLGLGLGSRVAPIRSMVSRKRSFSGSESVALPRERGISGSTSPGRETARGRLVKRSKLSDS